MAEAARWYLVLTVLGVGALLPAMTLFGTLRSGGALYARPLGLLLVAEAAWLASALGGARYGLPLILVACTLLFGWSAAIAWWRRGALAALWERRCLLIAGEGVALFIFALATLARAQSPAARDTEKPMDLMILASLHRADALPPPDAWLAGHELAYYHLGHTMVDVTARLAGVPVGPAVNLGTAAAAALAGAAVFALAGDVLALSTMRRRATPWIAGALAVGGLLLLAPVEGFAELIATRGLGDREWWAALGVAGFPGPAETLYGVPTQFWWWWRASRILPNVITEFPAFSIVLGDMHAHVLALPLGVVATAGALPAFSGRVILNWSSWRRNPEALVIAGALFAAIVMTNSWDVLVYGALWAAACLAALIVAGWSPPGAAMLIARYLVAPVVLALAIAWRLLQSLQAPLDGIAPVLDRASDPTRLLLFWMPLVLPLVAGAVLLRSRLPRRALGIAMAFGGSLIGGWIAWVVISDNAVAAAAFTARGTGWLTLGGLVLAVGGAGALFGGAIRERDFGRAAWLGLAAVALTVLLITELAYLREAFANRMNTVFKLWYAVWLLFAVASAAAAAMAYDRRASLRPRWLVLPLLAVVAMLWGGSLLYAPAAAVARSREGTAGTIDGLATLRRSDPGMAAAVAWAGEYLGPVDGVLEAVGKDYSAENGFSAASGTPTVLGWVGHELQWRGNIPEFGERQRAIDDIYRGGASEASAARAREYRMGYVYLGRTEREQYGPDVVARFDAWPVAFEADDVRIVAVPVVAR